MLKGVHQRIVEVKGQQEDYFERAILFIKPEKYIITQKGLNTRARRFLAGKTQDSTGQKRRAAAGTLLGYLLAGAMGALAVFLWLYPFS